MKRAAVALLAFPIGVFAGDHIQPYGPDTFIITTASYSSSKASAAAVKHANAFCDKQGKVMAPVNTEQQPAQGPGLARKGGYSLVFRCDPKP